MGVNDVRHPGLHPLFRFVALSRSRGVGFHRKLGTHLAKVKSVTLDSWKKDQLDLYKHMSTIFSLYPC